MKDALGNNIEIGNWYGYSRMSNGIVTVVVGKAINTTDKRVTLSEIIRQWGAYGNPNTIRESKNTSVYPRTVFPVDINQLNIQENGN